MLQENVDLSLKNSELVDMVTYSIPTRSTTSFNGII